MSILDRYITRQMLVTAIFAISVLSVVLVLGNIFKKLFDLLVNHNAPPDLILSIVAYLLPFSLTFTIPWGFLTAVLLVFGRLSGENELTAMRANGVSIARTCVPVGLMAAAFTVICLWINLEMAPRAQEKMLGAFFKIATQNPMSIFRSDEVISEFPGQKIYVEKNDGNTLKNVMIYRLDESDNSLSSVMFAREGKLQISELNGAKQLLLQTIDGRFEQRDENHPEDLSRYRNGITVQNGSTSIPLAALYEKSRKKGGLGTLTLEQLLKTEKKDVSVEVNKRISNALATLAFALLAIPLAITAQRKETSVGFAISLAIGLTYYLLFFIADMARGRASWHPELLVWIPNILFMAAGIWRFKLLARR